MGTLNQHRKRPTLAPLDLRHTPLKEIVANYKPCRAFLSTADVDVVTHPESDAIEFYLKNAAYAKLAQSVHPDAPLGEAEALLESYHATVRVKALRMFYYLLLICTRESRHLHHSTLLYDMLGQQFGSACVNFTKTIKGQSSDGAVSALLIAPPDTTLGIYTDYLVTVFDKGASMHLWSGGYGGTAWGNVAKVLRNFVHNVLSAELMLDTAFTLAHNNGPIFNKQVLYHHYDQYELVRILDVQRAGMIPQFVNTVPSNFITVQAREFMVEATRLLGDFSGEVDWHMVEALGAKQSYATEKKQAAKATIMKGGLVVPGVTLMPTTKQRKSA